jgi:hypothetical protein
MGEGWGNKISEFGIADHWVIDIIDLSYCDIL